MGLLIQIPIHQGQSVYSHCLVYNQPTAATNTGPTIWKPINQLVAGWLCRKGQCFVLTRIASHNDKNLPSMFLPKSPSMNLQKALSTVMAFHSYTSGFHMFTWVRFWTLHSVPPAHSPIPLLILHCLYYYSFMRSADIG